MRIVLATAVIAALSTSAAAGEPHPRQHCFSISQYEGWRAADDKTVYIRADVSHYYRLDFAQVCSELTLPEARLIITVRGPDTICSALDLDIKVNQYPDGVAQPCIVKTLTELTPAEAAALPKKFKP